VLANVEEAMTQGSAKASQIDFYRERPAFFKAGRKPELVDLPEASYLAVDGEGAPDGQQFQDAISALYSVDYTLKFSLKKSGRDFKVPTFEGLWWIYSDGQELLRDQWRWRLLMMVPDFIDAPMLDAAFEDLIRKKKEPQAAVQLDRVRHGRCVQVLHVGPYDAETPSIEKMRAFMAERQLMPIGPHHEVYLGDPRRSKPEALKTILRQPVESFA
jgi:hypothetical protein